MSTQIIKTSKTLKIVNVILLLWNIPCFLLFGSILLVGILGIEPTLTSGRLLAEIPINLAYFLFYFLAIISNIGILRNNKYAVFFSIGIVGINFYQIVTDYSLEEMNPNTLIKIIFLVSLNVFLLYLLTTHLIKNKPLNLKAAL